MSELAGRQSEGVEPIAWVRGNGNVVVVATDKIGGFAELSGNGLQTARSWHDDLPADAVPLVPATELDEARKDAEWLLAEARWIADTTMWVIASHAEKFPIQDDDGLEAVWVEDLAERGYEAWRAIYPGADVEGPPQWCDVRPTTEEHWLSWAREMRGTETTLVREQAEAAPQLPALDTPEALRYAADVCDQDVPMLVADPLAYKGPKFAAHLREKADRLEREADAAARVDAEREARIEELAQALDNAMPVGCLANYPSDDTGDIATALDALGYRLDPTQAKP